MTLVPYSGKWDVNRAAHLLRRTLYGPSPDMFQRSVSMGLEKTIDHLLRDVQAPEPPLYFNFNNDPHTVNGESWVNKPYVQGIGVNNARIRSLGSWTIGQTLPDRWSIMAKMVIFWHNHFVVAQINDPRYLYFYINSIEKHALGNFQNLAEAMTIEPAMLRYLNGNQNSRVSPNENYARELLELFTVGKGETADEGDYTTFTEHDVREIAKALTGWRDYGYRNQNDPDIYSYYTSNRHDKSIKILSHRFNHAVINNNEENEYKSVLRILLTSRHTALHLSRSLYRWFVHHDVNDEVEKQVIHPMAEILVKNQYNIRPVLKALLSSESFFDDEIIGCMIKNPLDFTLTAWNAFTTSSVAVSTSTVPSPVVLFEIFKYCNQLQMGIYNHPSVAGWKAYYQGPSYYQNWISTTTLSNRIEFIDYSTGKTNRYLNFPNRNTDFLQVIDQLKNPTDINELIEELCLYFYSQPLSPFQFDNLKGILIPGLPDFEWTVEYNAFKQNPNDKELYRIILQKIINLFNTMMKYPEYQLM